MVFSVDIWRIFYQENPSVVFFQKNSVNPNFCPSILDHKGTIFKKQELNVIKRLGFRATFLICCNIICSTQHFVFKKKTGSTFIFFLIFSDLLGSSTGKLQVSENDRFLCKNLLFSHCLADLN